MNAHPACSRGRGRARLAALGALVLAAGCSGSAERPRLLYLDEFVQADIDGVRLNETLVFYFSADLDPTSITSGSLRIAGPGGRPPRGQVEVVGRALRFTPEPPVSGDLADGGFALGARYDVVLGGFPRPDGVRSLEGWPLESTLHLSFRTVPVDMPPEAVFAPASSAPMSLRLVSNRIESVGPILLACDGPVNPATLRSEDFELHRYVAGSASEDRRLERIPLRARLRENTLDAAVIELRAVADATGERLVSLERDSYHLWWVGARDFRLRDLSNNYVSPPLSQGPVEIQVVKSREGVPGPEHHVSFLGEAGRSPAAVEGADGTAWWTETGTVTVRLPVSAGTGEDGRVELGEREERKDVHAVALRVPQGRRSELTGPGLVVLRAQGSLVVDGTLTRTVEEPPRARGELELHRDWLDRLKRRPADEGVPLMGFRYVDLESAEPGDLDRLAHWLEDTAEADPAWTVLVCGGDLVVNGDIRVDGPLLLAAGGWIRVSGRIEAREVWKVGEGGGNAIEPRVQPASLAFEAPLVNPLQEPLTWALLSAPLRPELGVSRWQTASFEGRRGIGSYRVRFLGERGGAGTPFEVVGPVDDPVLLEGCQAVRLLIELEVGTEGPWDPPVVDTVDLSWEEDGGA